MMMEINTDTYSNEVMAVPCEELHQPLVDYGCFPLEATSHDLWSDRKTR